MRTVSALFDTYDQVVAAVDELSDAGIAGSDITVIQQRRGAGTKMTEGVSLGASLGLLAGFAALTLPGVTAAVGEAWWISALIGLAVGSVAGGVIASLGGARAEAEHAQIPAGGARCGGTLVVARVHDSDIGTAKAILLHSGAIDTNRRRGDYASGSWEGFVAKDIWDDDIGNEDADRAPVRNWQSFVARSPRQQRPTARL